MMSLEHTDSLGLPPRPATVPLQTTQGRVPASSPSFQSSILQGAHEFQLEGVNFNTVSGNQHNTHNNDYSSTVNSNNRYGPNSNNKYSGIRNSRISNGDVINSTNNSTVADDYDYSRQVRNGADTDVYRCRTQDQNYTSSTRDSSVGNGDVNYSTNSIRNGRNQRDRRVHRHNSPSHNSMDRNYGSRQEDSSGLGFADTRGHYDHSDPQHTLESFEEREGWLGSPPRPAHHPQSFQHPRTAGYNEQRQGDIPMSRNREYDPRGGRDYYEGHYSNGWKNDEDCNTYPAEAPYTPSDPSIDNTFYPSPSPPSHFRPPGGFSQPQSHRSSPRPESGFASHARSATSSPPPSRFPTNYPSVSSSSSRNRRGNFHGQGDQLAGDISRPSSPPRNARGQRGSSLPAAVTEVLNDSDKPVVSYPPIMPILRLMDLNDKYKTMQSLHVRLCEYGFRTVDAVAVVMPERLEAIGIPKGRVKEFVEMCSSYARRAEKAVNGR